jgi:transposase
LLSCRTRRAGSGSGSCCRFSATHEPTVRIQRYPTDTTDAQWAVIDPLLPDPNWAKGRGGRREKHCRRMIVDAIFYVTDNGIKWRALPSDFPPWSTVYKRFRAWARSGAVARVMGAVNDRVRLAAGRCAAPSAAVIDSQSLRAAETVRRHSRGWDAGKKVNGRKRHIAVDTIGLLLAVVVTPASAQDRAVAPRLLTALRATSARLRHVWADGGYTGHPINDAQQLGLTMQIIQRLHTNTFTVLPRRWVVERTLAWITRHRRCARDYERHPTHHATYVHWAMIRILTRRLTQ